MNLKIKENLGMLLLLATIVTFNVIIGAKENKEEENIYRNI